MAKKKKRFLSSLATLLKFSYKCMINWKTILILTLAELLMLSLTPTVGCSQPALPAFTAISGTLQMFIVHSQLPRLGNFIKVHVNLWEKEQFALHGCSA